MKDILKEIDRQLLLADSNEAFQDNWLLSTEEVFTNAYLRGLQNLFNKAIDRLAKIIGIVASLNERLTTKLSKINTGSVPLPPADAKQFGNRFAINLELSNGLALPNNLIEFYIYLYYTTSRRFEESLGVSVQQFGKGKLLVENYENIQTLISNGAIVLDRKYSGSLFPIKVNGKFVKFVGIDKETKELTIVNGELTKSKVLATVNVSTVKDALGISISYTNSKSPKTSLELLTKVQKTIPKVLKELDREDLVTEKSTELKSAIRDLKQLTVIGNNIVQWINIHSTNLEDLADKVIEISKQSH